MPVPSEPVDSLFPGPTRQLIWIVEQSRLTSRNWLREVACQSVPPDSEEMGKRRNSNLYTYTERFSDSRSGIHSSQPFKWNHPRTNLISRYQTPIHSRVNGRYYLNPLDLPTEDVGWALLSDLQNGTKPLVALIPTHRFKCLAYRDRESASIEALAPIIQKRGRSRTSWV